ncbi:hypothetical protein BSKO_09713 [Bryopsis sp. KO-2023]|nr:hypothetical protein BSKO_09713 [Bryopsis sp. KO-2023]
MSSDQDAVAQLQEPASMFQDPFEDDEYGPAIPELVTGDRKDFKTDGVALELALEKNHHLEREIRRLKERLRRTERELTDIKVAGNPTIHARNAAEARDRAAMVDATSDDVTRAVHQRDSSLVELRRKLEVVRKNRFVKPDKEEENDKDEEEGSVAATAPVVARVVEDSDDDDVGTSYASAEDEDVRSVQSIRVS